MYTNRKNLLLVSFLLGIIRNTLLFLRDPLSVGDSSGERRAFQKVSKEHHGTQLKVVENFSKILSATYKPQHNEVKESVNYLV